MKNIIPVMNQNRAAIALAAVLTAGIGALWGASPAAATEPEAYVLVAWTINTPGFDGTGDVWGGGGQDDPLSLPTSSADLDQIKATVPCGRWVQIDLYKNDETTAALLAGKKLLSPYPQVAPQLPESPADVNPWYVSSWWSGDCPQPDDVVTNGSSEVVDCAALTITTHTWTETITYTGDKFGWVAGEPVRVEASSIRAADTTVCPTEDLSPALALTGPDDVRNGWLVAGAIAGLLLGLILWAFFGTYSSNHKVRHRADIKAAKKS